MIEQFISDVDEGLSSEPKTLPSKYFYDKIGDELFVEIMNMPEYYLTRAEFEIFKEQSSAIIDEISVGPDSYFELIELGAGDGTKTKELLKVLVERSYTFDYFPIDISKNALDGLEASLGREIPKLKVKARQGDYFEVLSSLKNTRNPKVILFMGSNLGNMPDEIATQFIYQLGSNLNSGDHLVLGVDLIKSEDVVLPAYNDKGGITSRFNLNLLERINRELGGDFEIEKFKHSPEYSAEEGLAKSYIESKTGQEVNIKMLGKTFYFEAGEKIHTEVSRKYNDEIINRIIANTDFEISTKLTDRKGYFADYILKR